MERPKPMMNTFLQQHANSIKLARITHENQTNQQMNDDRDDYDKLVGKEEDEINTDTTTMKKSKFVAQMYYIYSGKW